MLPAESERLREAEDELSDEGMPQLPASVHVRKSSVACPKVRARQRASRAGQARSFCGSVGSHASMCIVVIASCRLQVTVIGCALCPVCACAEQ